MDGLTSRIQKRVADPLRAVDAAAWVRPIPRMAPPATPAEVDAAEVALGFAIPRLLRRLYVEVGNGGFGPLHGLEGVATLPPLPGTDEIAALYQWYSEEPPSEVSAHVWPRGWVPLISDGCLALECLDFLRPPHAVARFDPDTCDLTRPVVESLRPVAPSLEARLEAWLAGGVSG